MLDQKQQELLEAMMEENTVEKAVKRVGIGKATGMYKDGTYKNETLKTDADLYRFFDRKSSVSVCMIKPFDGEVIKGSLYDKVTASDVDKIGKARIDRTFIDDVPEGDDEI